MLSLWLKPSTVQFHHLVAVTDRELIRERLQFARARCGRSERPLRQAIGQQRPRLRRQHDLLIEGAVFVVGDDGCAFRHVAANAAQMIEVIVGVDHILDRLVREGFADFRDDRSRHLILQAEHVLHVAFISLCPYMLVSGRTDQLRRDAHAVC